MSKTKVYDFPDCQEKVTINGVEVGCYLRAGHGGEHIGYYSWKSAQQSVQFDVCPVCRGTRQDPAYSEIPVNCPACGGTGKRN
jgi:hypothetical protein